MFRTFAYFRLLVWKLQETVVLTQCIVEKILNIFWVLCINTLTVVQISGQSGMLPFSFEENGLMLIEQIDEKLCTSSTDCGEGFACSFENIEDKTGICKGDFRYFKQPRKRLKKHLRNVMFYKILNYYFNNIFILYNRKSYNPCLPPRLTHLSWRWKIQTRRLAVPDGRMSVPFGTHHMQASMSN